MVFLGIIVWAKCFSITMKPMEILKIWTGAAVGVGIYVAEQLTIKAFGTIAGLIVLLILLFAQLVIDIGHISSWIVNPATPFFLTITIVMSQFMPLNDILRDFAASFVLVCLVLMVIGAILGMKKKNADIRS